MSHEQPATTVRALSERERAAWRAHNLENLRESAAWSFEHKLLVLEELEEVALASGYQRDPATGQLFYPQKSSPPRGSS